MGPVVQLTRTGTQRADAGTLARAREAFEQQQLIRIPGFLAPDLRDTLADLVERAEFKHRIHHDINFAVDVSIEDPEIRWTLIFLMNDPALFDAIRAITGCGPIGYCNPLVYKIVPDAGHFDSWHDDVDGNKMIGMSINLGRQPFSGGVLQIRRHSTEAILHHEHNTGFGDAMLFRIDDGLEHFVTPVTGNVPRLALAGWFQTTPDYREVARKVFGRLAAC